MIKRSIAHIKEIILGKIKSRIEWIFATYMNNVSYRIVITEIRVASLHKRPSLIARTS